MNVEDHRALEVVFRTVRNGKRMAALVGQICKADGCCKGEPSCFFEDMSKYDTGVPARVIKHCLYLMLLHDSVEDFRSLAFQAFTFLFPGHSDVREMRKKTTKEFEDRLKELPHMNLVQILLNELGYYLTYILSLTNNLRKLFKLAKKAMPAFHKEDDRKLASYIYNTKNLKLSIEHKKIVETCLFHAAFHGSNGFYGIFYQYMWLVIKALHPGRMGNLKAHFWMFDIDMRRIFISMGKTVNSMSEEFCTNTMPMVWPREFLGQKETLSQTKNTECRCGKPTVKSFYIYTGSPQPCDLNDQTLKLKFIERWYCEHLCYLEDFAKMMNFLAPALDAYKRQDANKFNSYSEMLQYATIRMDLHHLLTTAKESDKKKWPLLSEVKSIGFEWSEWPVPGTPNTPENEFGHIDLKFCWADECKNNHGVNRKTVTCGGCMKARYCNRECERVNHKYHADFCEGIQYRRKKALREAQLEAMKELLPFDERID